MGPKQLTFTVGNNFDNKHFLLHTDIKVWLLYHVCMLMCMVNSSVLQEIKENCDYFLISLNMFQPN